MSKASARTKSHNRVPFIGPFPENMLLSGRQMTAAACARLVESSDRGSQTGPIFVAPRLVRGMVPGRNPQTSIQERNS
jgi:hypothetical protein